MAWKSNVGAESNSSRILHIEATETTHSLTHCVTTVTLCCHKCSHQHNARMCKVKRLVDGNVFNINIEHTRAPFTCITWVYLYFCACIASFKLCNSATLLLLSVFSIRIIFSHIPIHFFYNPEIVSVLFFTHTHTHTNANTHIFIVRNFHRKRVLSFDILSHMYTRTHRKSESCYIYVFYCAYDYYYYFESSLENICSAFSYRHWAVYAWLFDSTDVNLVYLFMAIKTSSHFIQFCIFIFIKQENMLQFTYVNVIICLDVCGCVRVCVNLHVIEYEKKYLLLCLL